MTANPTSVVLTVRYGESIELEGPAFITVMEKDGRRVGLRVRSASTHRIVAMGILPKRWTAGTGYPHLCHRTA